MYEVGCYTVFHDGRLRWVGYTYKELEQLCGGKIKIPDNKTIRSVIREPFELASELAHTLRLTYKRVS